MRRRLAFAVLTMIGLLLLDGPAAGQASSSSVTVVSIDGAVDPLAARYVERAIANARDRGSVAVLVRIDTPGGLDSAMRRIVRSIQGSATPVLCFVGPPGARAASAGAIILLGCPVAAMAEGTNVGAAHPVGFQGEVLDEKVTNDAAAYARGLAERWGRNADLAERMVRRSVSLPAREALRQKVIDLIAADERALLAQADGRATRVTGDRPWTLRTAGATLVEERMTFMESLLHGAIDPNLAFLLFVLGLLGIVVEILHPGVTVPGVVGGLALLTALVILGMLPVNLAGLVLILAGIGFLALEANLPGIGVPAAAGVVSLLLGGLFLFDRSVPGAQVSRGLVIGTALSVGAFFAYAVRAALRTRKQAPAAATTADLIGAEGIVERVLDPTGIVRARNESWSARAAAGAIPAGARVRVVRVEGLTLEVEPAEATRPPAPYP